MTAAISDPALTVELGQRVTAALMTHAEWNDALERTLEWTSARPDLLRLVELEGRTS